MAKNFSKLIIPYNFKGFSFGSGPQIVYFLSRNVAEIEFGNDIFSSFSSVFTSVLTAMSDFDIDFLQNVMEKRLFEKTKADLIVLKDKNYKLSYIEPSPSSNLDNEEEKVDEKKSFVFQKIKHEKISDNNKLLHLLNHQYKEKDMRINLEPHGVLGVNINRDENAKQSNQKFLTFARKSRTYFLNMASPLDVFRKHILVLKVYYLSQRKLALLDEENFLIQGTEDPDQWVSHRWRFETKPDKLDWILTDMDDYLKGNPYFL